MSVNQNLCLPEGNDRVLRFTPDGEPPEGGIGGWTILFALKKTYADAAPRFTVPAAIEDAAAGIYSVALTAADTAQAPGKFVWDVRRTDPGFEWTLAEGYLQITPGVLR